MQTSLFSNDDEVILPYNPKHKEDVIGEVLIENLDLDIKIINYLKKGGYFKIKDLVDKGLSPMKGIGKYSISEVKKAVNTIALKLKDTSINNLLVNKKRVSLSISELEEYGEVLIENLDLDIKIINYLKKGGYFKIKDLVDKDLFSVKGIRNYSINKIKKAIDVIVGRNIKDKSNIKHFDLKEFIEKTLDEKELNVISDRFGLLGKEKTLEEIGHIKNVTRERVRQIQNKGVEKLKRKIHYYPGGKIFLKNIFESSIKNQNVNDLQNLSSIYNPKGVAKLLSIMYPNEIVFYTNKLLSIDLITHPNNIDELDQLVENIKKLLCDQIGYVDIDEVSKYFKCDRKYVESQKNVDIDGNLIAIKSNKKALNKDKYYEVENILRNNPRPVHIKEIMKKTSMTERETRSIIERMKRKIDIVNVGLSLYSLKEFGYKNLPTKELIVDLLKEAEEPITIKSLIKIVQNRRIVSKTTIIMALMDKNIFVKPIKGYVALKEWQK